MGEITTPRLDRRGILLVNLGSPDEPTPAALRRYLHQFLMDGRVIDVPYPIRKLIVSGFILPFRPKKSAEAYHTIWWKEGAPLIVLSRKAQRLLQEHVTAPVEIAMRYGNPSVRSGIEALLARSPRIEEILAIPMYPHYAMSSYESSVVEVQEQMRKLGNPVPLKVVAPYYDWPAYVDALVESARGYFEKPHDHVLFSYHGLPERHLRKSDPTKGHCLVAGDCCSRPSPAHARCYRHQVFETTRLVAERAGLEVGSYSVSFQSRLGRDKWLSPATADEFRRLGEQGVRRLLVMCPAFVTDCLETLEEIGMGGKEIFLGAGGESFEMIPCLNTHPAWIEALRQWSTSEETPLLQ